MILAGFIDDPAQPVLLGGRVSQGNAGFPPRVAVIAKPCRQTTATPEEPDIFREMPARSRAGAL